jgi:hypothetical protein
MNHSMGDAIIVAAIAAAIYGYYYLRFRERQRRLELIHQERIVAMDKGIPLPELPIDPPPQPNVSSQHVPLILGIMLTAFGGGMMITLGFVASERPLWPFPLPLALMGGGLILYHLLAVERSGGRPPA